MRKRLVAIVAACCVVAGAAVALQSTGAQASYPTTQMVNDHVSGTTSSASISAQIACPAGQYATGGGAENDLNDPHNWVLQESAPLLDTGVPKGWFVRYRYMTGTPSNVAYDIVVYAICTT